MSLDFKTNEEIATLVCAKMEEVTLGISRALKVAGVKHSLRKSGKASYVWGAQHSIDLGDTGVRIAIKDERRFQRWNGKLRVNICGIRSTKQFPERKNGFDYAAIAGYIKEAIRGYQEWIDSAKRTQENRDAAEEIETRVKADFPDLLDNWGSKVRLENKGRVDGFEIRIHSLDEAEVRALAETLRGFQSLLEK